MREPARHRHLAQAFEQHVGRAAHVQNDRQTVLPRQLQLGRVKRPLPLTQGGLAQGWHKIIQTNFPHRHQARVVFRRSQGIVQGVQVIVMCLRHIQRVDAQGISVAVAVRQRLHRAPMGPRHRRDHAQAHACTAGLLTHRVAVGIKLGRVQVAMGVDPHA